MGAKESLDPVAAGPDEYESMTRALSESMPLRKAKVMLVLCMQVIRLLLRSYLNAVDFISIEYKGDTWSYPV